MAILCWLRGHSPDRRRARFDGVSYWSSCRRCGTNLVRGFEDWRLPTSAELQEHRALLVERDREAAAKMPRRRIGRDEAG